MPFPVEIRAWAVRHGVGDAALADLAATLGVGPGAPGGAGSESNVQARVRLAAPGLGMRLWRNNVGVLRDERGVPVRYGLANDSAALNARLKSHDLIGWRRVAIEQEHVGSVIAQFVSLECKRADWRPALPTNARDYAHELAQTQWAALVAADGGFSQFVTGPEQIGA